VKGVELPINILVIVAVAVIVLLGVIALYFAGFLGPAGTVSLQSVTTTACGTWRAKGGTTSGVSADTIEISNYDADGDGTLDKGSGCLADNLETLGVNKYGTAVCSGSSVTATDNDIQSRVCGLP